ncbi:MULTISPECIES: hypothetical protein [unclassified Mesorhizobium]|nr:MULTISPECIES: hypothetical protein [unclassified Mesorhizobium]
MAFCGLVPGEQSSG